ncbi:conserved exported hypothetical protein [Candidatus Sulfopaludibacter sp. SbA3]|nr:conserved exported hypothetical protein [Candidatus Sulfopaludibacter sp. SbA3]
MKKSLILAGALSLSAICFAATKSYDVVLSAPAKAGSITLAAGEYKLQVQGSNAVFTDTKTRKTFTTPIKVESGAKKYQYTAVDTAADQGSEKITSIELGGSTTQIDF